MVFLLLLLLAPSELKVLALLALVDSTIALILIVSLLVITIQLENLVVHDPNQSVIY